MLRLISTALVATTLFTATAQANGHSTYIQISSLDGSAKIAGHVIAWDTKKLIFRGAYGLQTLERDKFICQGEGCPPRT